jgi:hypothetical protein
MKTIQITNGETRIGYEFADLNPTVQQDVLYTHSLFMEYVEEEDGYEPTDDEVIEFIEINKYLFDENGMSLPITYHYDKNELLETTFTYGQEHHLCLITNK